MIRKIFYLILPIAAIVWVNSTYGSLLIKGRSLELGAGNPIASDLYVFSQNFDNERAVQGDLIAFCQWLYQEGAVEENLYGFAQTIEIDGDVGGDFIGFAQNIRVDAQVGGGIRAACSDFRITSLVDGEAVIAAGKVVIEQNAVINGNLYVFCEEVDIAGEIRGNLFATVEKFRLSGTAAKNVKVVLTDDEEMKETRKESDEGESQAIFITSTGTVEGNFIYCCPGRVDESFSSSVKGDVIYREWLPKEIEKGCGFCWMFKTLLLIANLIIAFILIGFFRIKMRELFESFAEKPWRTLLIGLLGFIVIPVAALIALALVLTIPLSAILIVVYGLFLYLGWITAGTLLGTLVFNLFRNPAPSLFLSALIGLPLLCLLGWIPFIGVIVSLAALICGMGLMMVWTYMALRP